MSRFPSTDKQCSARDAIDVLTPERAARGERRWMCEMSLACQRHKGQTNITGRCSGRAAHYRGSLAVAVSQRNHSVIFNVSHSNF